MALKSVLILTASYGEGHNAAARNLASALREVGVAVEVRDIFAETYPRVNALGRKLYLAVINHAPHLWRVAYALLGRTSLVKGGLGIFHRATRQLTKTISRMKPDVLVSTFPGYGHLLDRIRNGDGIENLRVVTIVTDSLTINPVWHQCGSDFFLVPNEATAEVMRKAGVPSEKLRATGFPVSLVFSEPEPQRSAPPFEVLFMVNSAHHLAAKVVAALLEIPDIHLTVTVGHNELLGRHLKKIAQSAGKMIEVHGWTPEIPALLRRSHLLISKAGGATVQEALAARTPMLLTQIIPGQEEGNARLLIENGVGEVASTPTDIAEAVRRMFRENGRLHKVRQLASASLSPPDAARRTVAFLESLQNPQPRPAPEVLG
ncbi:MAG: glycosyltransferase [Chthoniobacterales bacterium]|nr:glycosyltransferase [Chthoniobacterales bacterium]